MLLKTLTVLLAAMWIGGVFSAWLAPVLATVKMALPAYIGAMIVAAADRNLDDWLGWIGLSQQALDDLGQRRAVAVPRHGADDAAALGDRQPGAAAGGSSSAQVALHRRARRLWPVYRLMGRDYEGAVTSSGFCGFMLGTTANAMANMEALVEKYGPAPRAFLVVPMVGAFFIDATNALIISSSSDGSNDAQP